MEIITAIALLCQIGFGYGDGGSSGYSTGNFKKSMDRVRSSQKTCQKQLAECILKGDKNNAEFRTSTALKCIKER